MRQNPPPPAEVNALLALYNSRRYAEAESSTRALLAQYPDFGFGWKLLGGTLQMQGKEALPAFEKVAELMPGDPEAHYNLGVVLKSSGRLDDAVASYHRALKLKPDYYEAHSNLSNTLKDLGQLDDAVASYRRALQIKPDSADAHNNLGTALKESGQLDDAVASYRRAVALKPDFVLGYYNLGNAHRELGQLDDAVKCYRQAVMLNPDFSLAYFKLGLAQKDLGQFDDVADSFRHVVKIKPDFAEAYNNLGNALKELRQFYEAVDNYRIALKIKPDFADAHNNLGMALREVGQLDAALASYRRALQIKPDWAEAYLNLGSVLRELGHFKEAKNSYWQAHLLGYIGAKVRYAMMLPSIMGNQQEILESRAEFERSLDQLIAEQVKLEDPLGSSIETNFYMSYHGLDDLDLQIKVVKFYEQASPSLLYASSHCTIPRPIIHKKIRVGFISAFFTHHPVSSCFSKIIEALSSREQFDVWLLSEHPVDNTVYSKFAGQCVHLPHNLGRSREVIAGLELDVLIYLDIGMEPFSFLLAFSRLARVQCVLGGHPVTTGITNIDYFLSTELTEPADADAHYSEELVRFKKATSYFARPSIPATLKTRHELGLPEERRLYMCPTKLQKVHPDFDEAMAQILTIDNEGVVVLFEDAKYPVWKENLVKRFEKTIPAAIRERIMFLPWLMNKTDFISALAGADVILDPFHFGSGSTLSFIFATGTPLVTKPGKFMRGRIGMGHCMAMGLTECIAEDTDEYAEKAVAIATDRSLREKISAKILSNNAVYYENLQAVEELSEFIHSLEDSWRSV